MAAFLISAILNSPILHKTLTQSNSIWLKLIHSHLIWLWQSLQFGHIGFNHLSYSSYTHSHLPRLVPTICTKKTYSHLPPHHLHKKTFTHSFWLNLMITAILNSAILNSPILHKTLTQTNSIWLKLIHSHLTWWWQPSRILPSWIQPFWTKLWLKLIQSDSNSFILTLLDDGSHLQFGHLGFSHFAQK